MLISGCDYDFIWLIYISNNSRNDVTLDNFPAHGLHQDLFSTTAGSESGCSAVMPKVTVEEMMFICEGHLTFKSLNFIMHLELD